MKQEKGLQKLIFDSAIALYKEQYGYEEYIKLNELLKEDSDDFDRVFAKFVEDNQAEILESAFLYVNSTQA